MQSASLILVGSLLPLLSLLSLVSCQSLRSSQSLSKNGLRCCTMDEAPIASLQSGKLHGIASVYLDGLKEEIGFKCASLKYFNGTGIGFDSFVDHMEACTEESTGRIRDSPECQCDIGIGGWMQNPARYGRVDYLPPFIIDGYEVMVHADNTSRSSGGVFFLHAFSVPVWGCIATLFIFFSFLKLLDQRFAPLDESFVPLRQTSPRWQRLKYFLMKQKHLRRLRKAVQSTRMWLESNMILRWLGRMVGNGGTDPVQEIPSTRHWVLNFAIALCSLFLVLAYEASMTAFLVQEKIISDYQSIKDFKSCRIPAKEVCILRESASAEFWENSIASASDQGCYQEETSGKPIEVKSYDDGMEKLAKKECKFLFSLGSVIRHAANRGKYCRKLVQTGEPSFEAGLSFLVPKGSDLTEKLSKATLKLRRSSLIPRLTDYIEEGSRCQNLSTSTPTFGKLGPFFLLAFAACAVILLEMLFDPQTAVKASEQDPGTESGTERI